MNSPMRITLVAAMSLNRVIGNKGELPWRLPADLARFKQLTMNHAVIMGRKTFDSIRKPLLGRSNIVITRQRDWRSPSVTVAHDLNEAKSQAKELDSRSHHQNEIMILGGAEIYRQSMSIAHRIHLTVVELECEGDAFFPDFDQSQWKLVSDEAHPADDKNPYAMRFQKWERSSEG